MRFKFGLTILSLLVLMGCEKSPGVGGDSSISGTLLLYQYNDNYSQRANATLAPAQDVDVYIQYGDDELIQDKIETSPEGYFEFNSLYEGEYKIIYYSENAYSAEREKEAIITEVNLSKNQSEDLGNLEYVESLDYDEGIASISGQVKEVTPTYYGGDTLLVLDLAVFIRPLHHKAYADRIRTQGDGSFCFENLIPGDYEIYVFSEDIKGSNQDVSIKDTISVNYTEITYEMEDLIIYNM